MKTHFKIRKLNFKKVLFKNDKSKKVLEIDVKKDGGIFFSIKIFLVNMDNPFKYCKKYINTKVYIRGVYKYIEGE